MRHQARPEMFAVQQSLMLTMNLDILESSDNEVQYRLNGTRIYKGNR